MLRNLSAVPRFAVTALIILAIVNLLVGVILRYFVGAITDWLDVDPVPFTWVEEVGEFSLAWLTLIGAAIGIQSRSHFALAVFVHRLPVAAQLWIHRFNHALIMGVGLLAAWYGFKLCLLNRTITTILQRPDIKDAWEKQGATPLLMTQPQFDAFMKAEIVKWAKVIKDNHIALIN